MSYDIDKWKTKELKDFTIPLKAFFTHERTDWHPEMATDITTGVTVLSCGCEQELVGVIKEDNFIILEFDMNGEGSGTFFNWILRPAFAESSGVLKALLVWEGGDTIENLYVTNGKVETIEAEL